MIQIQARIQLAENDNTGTVSPRVELDLLSREDVTEFEQGFAQVVQELMVKAILRAANEVGLNVVVNKVS